MKRAKNKSDCPINFSIETFGDQWSLLIIRDMLIFRKQTFSDFLLSKERIGRSVLSERLKALEQDGIISKRVSSNDKRGTLYWLTEKGIRLIPLMYELAVWGVAMSSFSDGSKEWERAILLDRDELIECWKQAVRLDSSFLIGPKSVAKQLGIT